MKHPLKETAILIILFIIAQLVGLTIIQAYVDTEKSVPGKTEYKQIPGIERPQVEKQTSYIYVIIAVLIGSLMFIFTSKFARLWKVWYLIAITLTLGIALVPLFNSGWAFLVGLALAIWKIFRRNIFIHNLTELMVYGGLAALFVPLFNLFSVSILLLVISVYDIIAVNYTKHMISMAKTMSVQNIFPGFKINYSRVSGKSYSSADSGEERISKNKNLKKQARGTLEEIRVEKGKVGKTIHYDGDSVQESKGSIAILGGGDVAFPLFFSGVIMESYGFPKATIVTLFSTIALAILFYLSKKGKFYPAMPAITAGCFVAFGIIKLIS